MPPRRVIGIDAGGTKLLGGCRGRGPRRASQGAPTWRGADRSETLDIIFDAVEEVRAAAPTSPRWASASRALVESDTGVAHWSTHLPLAGVRFRDVMSERVGLPVIVDNDANAALVAESRFGAARDVRHAVLVALGTGIGSALLLNGEIYRGARGTGAEIGHMVIDLNGPDCQGNCPGRGCLEVMASGLDDRARGPGRGGGAAGVGARAPAGRRPGDHRGDRHRAGPRGRRGRRGRARASRPALGRTAWWAWSTCSTPR